MRAENEGFDFKKLIWDLDLTTKVGVLELMNFEQNANAESLKGVNLALTELMNSLSEFKELIAYSDRELEGKVFRFIMANGSFIKLLDKSDLHIKNKCYPVLDVFTINTIMRMQIETFLMIFYLCFFEGEQLERNMRYDLYKLNGLKKQLTFEATTLENKKKQTEVKNEYDAVLNNLTTNKFFENHDEKRKRELLKFNYSKTVKTDILFSASGIDKIGFDNIWSLFSNHTHSEYLSDRQYNSIYKKGNLTSLNVDLNILFHIRLTAKLCMFLLKKFESPQKVVSLLSKESRVLIYIWGYKMHRYSK